MKNKNKILLIFPRLEPNKDYHYMPISALAVASKLINQEKEVIILDQRVEKKFYELLDKYLKDITNVLITAFSGYQVTEAYHISKWIKEYHPFTFITWGGPHTTCLPKQTLESKYVDDVWTGYAEKGENLIPWHLVNANKYINPDTERFIYISSYGCPGQCTFCATKNRRELVFLPPEKIEKDIENLMNLYLFKECVMFDATLFTKPMRALFIAEIMKKHKLKWICDSRADEICRTPRSWLDDIIASGLKQITIGLESGSPKVVENMKKGKNHLEYYKKCAEIMSEYDVKMCSGVIFGTPGETQEDIKQTIKYIKEIKKINPNFYISTTFFKPLPDTIMSDMAKKYGYIEPQSLKEWAKQGEEGHYHYNQWDDVPWIENKKEYKEIYDNFVADNGDLFM
ncbi:MAG: B12-binding domain-containing radical SAM protein [Candidatus Odinarchaeota archaeon]